MSAQSEKKQKMLDRIAEENGVAVVVLDERSRQVSVSNNNSICKALTSSSDFAPRCAEYCGVAFQKTAAGDDFDYECYAGLTCKAIPVADRGKRFVAIIGRTFTSARNYRQATERAIAGDWHDFPPNEFFENVLMDSSTLKLTNATSEVSQYPFKKTPEALDLNAPAPGRSPQEPAQTTRIQTTSPRPVAATLESSKPPDTEQSAEERSWAAEAAAMRSFQNRLSNMEFPAACEMVLDFAKSTFNLESLVWLESRDNDLVPVAAKGSFHETPIRIDIGADNEGLVAAGMTNTSLELRERIHDQTQSGRTLHLFPSVVGGEVRGSLGVEGSIEDGVKHSITRLCRRVGPQLEILRLKNEVSSREWLRRATRRFTEILTRIDAEDFWTHVTQISAELVQSERASLLMQSERAEGLRAKAAVGAKIDLLAEPQVGSRVAQKVLDHGKPVVVPDISQTRMKSAPRDWQYKTRSFISYPILIGDRRLAVMNFTDKAGGAVFEERDVELLDAFVPQIALAIDRTSLKDMAGEFEQLSVTDALTGLLNRRYLEKRLNEEIERSKRHRFPMSLMMLDVDDFKSYNDTFGHPAGDMALKIVANVLKDILRGADVAARYGGEEFSILLPQTTSAEAAAIAERLRQRIERTEFPKRKVTISIGIASCLNEIGTPEDIIGAADHALYEAKNHGRNNVQIYDDFGKPFKAKLH